MTGWKAIVLTEGYGVKKLASIFGKGRVITGRGSRNTRLGVKKDWKFMG